MGVEQEFDVWTCVLFLREQFFMFGFLGELFRGRNGNCRCAALGAMLRLCSLLESGKQVLWLQMMS